MTLKPRTRYYCSEPDCGYSIYTGDGERLDDISHRGQRLGHRLVEAGPENHTITFEYVSPLANPGLYNGDRPIVSAESVPDMYWHPTQRTGDETSIRDQFVGLHELIGRGELIRNVRVFRQDAPLVELDWGTPS